MDTIKCYTSWRRFFTPIWWKLQILSLLTGRPPLNIVATFTIERSKNELLKEAYNRFKQYEMDVDDHPPNDHAEFMKKLRAEIDA